MPSLRQSLFGFLILLLCLSVLACEKAEKTEDERALVRYAVARPERIVLTTRLPGRVAALEMSEVRPQVDGIIQERLFEEGALVQKGQVLYQIDAARYQAAWHTAQAELAEAEAAITALANQEKRRRSLSKENAVSRQDLDNAISEHAQAKARIARAKAALETAAINLAYTTLRAPISGRIGKSSVTPGALVTAHQPTALAVIWQTERVYVDLTQSSVEALRLRRALAEGRLSRGKTFAVSLILEDGSPYTALNTNADKTPIKGSLLFSEQAVRQSTGGILLRVAFDNPDGLLLPGMYVTALVEEGVREQCLLVPQASVLLDTTGRHYLCVLTPRADGLFSLERRYVRLGRRIGSRWIIEAGLSSGEIYLVSGLQNVVPEQKVKGEEIEPLSETP
ncbi:MAG: efflux RND transporter periplasmic adaptor subunit [Desulfovibrio sp.]|nr:efflux RND transporter periplasmic adaptor subunit [Desulfovibrio sp.]